MGDVEVLVDGAWYYVEIKECHANTINQVRAIKYLPLVVFTPGTPKPWLVLAPHELAAIVARRSRGQHNENPFECAALSLGNMPEGRRCTDTELDTWVKDALHSGNEHHEVKALLEEIHTEIVQLSESAKRRIIKAVYGPAAE